MSVLKIQQCLNLIQPDLNLKEDGIFDEKTEQAIMKFQKSTGLDLRVFEDAITFKIALMVVKYMKYMESLEY